LIAPHHTRLAGGPVTTCGRAGWLGLAALRSCSSSRALLLLQPTWAAASRSSGGMRGPCVETGSRWSTLSAPGPPQMWQR
jgi:hypothetical protein